MIVLLLALLAAAPDQKAPALPRSIDGLPIGAIPQQRLPEKGCAAYLWSAGTTHALVAMATADPAQARISLAGAITDLARTAQSGIGGYGFSRRTEYRAGDVVVTLDVTISSPADLSGGAVISGGTMQLDRPGEDTIVLPVAGLIGCA